MRPELPPPAAAAEGEVLTAALLDSLRFVAYPEVPAVLRALRGSGITLVVVSNWDVSLHERLAETGLAALIDGAVASAEVGVAKPDPAIFAHALSIAGVRPEAAWHVGDSVAADVAGALAAGLVPVLVARDGAPRAADPRVRTVAALDGLPALWS
jgi:putative hydrolase of the HAD superfamily